MCWSWPPGAAPSSDSDAPQLLGVSDAPPDWSQRPAGAPQPGLEGGLERACADNDMKGVAEMIARGADVDARDGAGRTALHVACAFPGLDVDSPALAALLCGAGADPDAMDGEGVTPLMLAVQEVGYCGSAAEATVAVLLAHGADARAADAAGRTALHHAGAGFADPCFYWAPDAAEAVVDLQTLRRVVRRLLAAGADPAAPDAAGRPPAAAAAAAGNALALMALAQEGAAPAGLLTLTEVQEEAHTVAVAPYLAGRLSFQGAWACAEAAAGAAGAVAGARVPQADAAQARTDVPHGGGPAPDAVAGTRRAAQARPRKRGCAWA